MGHGIFQRIMLAAVGSQAQFIQYIMLSHYMPVHFLQYNSLTQGAGCLGQHLAGEVHPQQARRVLHQ